VDFAALAPAMSLEMNTGDRSQRRTKFDNLTKGDPILSLPRIAKCCPGNELLPEPGDKLEE
jgi:hypothetical protein